MPPNLLELLGLRSDDLSVVDPLTGRTTIPRVLPNGQTIDQVILANFPQLLGRGGQAADPALAEALASFLPYGDNNLQELILQSENPDVRAIGNQLVTNATLTDKFSFFGDNLFPALALLAVGVGGAALAGGFSAAGGAGTGVAAAGAAEAGGAGLSAGGAVAGGAGAAGAGGAGLAAGAGGGSGLLGAGVSGGATLAGIPLSSLIGPAVTAGSTLASGLIGADAAKDATNAQVNAATQSNQLLRDIYAQQQAQQRPFLEAGYAALPELLSLATGPQQAAPQFQAGGPIDPGQFALPAAPAPFVAPTAETLSQDPGYQFRLREGQRALESSAAARGGLLSGGFARGLTRYAQDAASQEFQNAFGRAAQGYQLRLQDYQVGANRSQQEFERANLINQQQYQRSQDQFRTNYDINQQQQTQRFNRLAALAGVGQTSAGTLGNAAGNYGSQAAQTLQGIGNAQAAGQIAGANALTGIIGGVGGAVNQFNANQQAEQQYQLLAALAAGR